MQKRLLIPLLAMAILFYLGFTTVTRTIHRDDFLRHTWAKETVFIELIDGKGEIWLDFHGAIIERIDNDGVTFLHDDMRWHWQGDALILDYCGKELVNKLK